MESPSLQVRRLPHQQAPPDPSWWCGRAQLPSETSEIHEDCLDKTDPGGGVGAEVGGGEVIKQQSRVQP